MGNFKYFTPLLRPSFDVGIFRPGGSQLAEVIHIGLGLGGEIHFGFIGVPRLSLTGLLGLGIDVLHTDAGTGLTTKTEGGSSLWGLVESSLALTYYW
jgi:hypothetical protein